MDEKMAVVSKRTVQLVTHDVNNPLTAIRILSEMLLGEVTDPMAQEDLKDIVEASDVAAATVEGLSLLLRASEGFRLGVTETLDLAALLQESIRRPAFKNCVELATSTGPALVKGDKRLIQSALTEVLMNARKMIDGRSRVVISLRTGSETVQVICHTVETGLAAEFWAPLLAENGAVYLRDNHCPVSPTGLFASHCILDLHQGKIDLSLEADGGLLVSCTFPAAQSGARR